MAYIKSEELRKKMNTTGRDYGWVSVYETMNSISPIGKTREQFEAEILAALNEQFGGYSI
jgi:hypothetical protein